jgi:thymidine phosphorylase
MAGAELLPAEVIRAQRDGRTLTPAQIRAFVRGLVDGSWSEGQIAALAMAIVWRGLDAAQTVRLTQAMAQSGEVLDWRGANLPGPVLDKHSSGGVGDKVSLLLAPIVAACGGVVPMVSGRGLGHTGGTLDKLEALPGYAADVPRERLLAVLRSAGCAIVGAGAALAPADRRLYAIRDVTATVESVPLIAASILSKKLAAGVQALVMDVKAGSGAFCRSADEARALACAIVGVARGAGLPAVALVSDMNQVLGRHAGNALEVREAIDALAGRGAEPRLLALTLALAGELLALGGLAGNVDEGAARARRALADGSAADRFARMVAGLGGPRDVLRDAGLAAAPVVRPVPAPRGGFVLAMDTRALGLAVVALGAGRRRPGDAVDPRVGLADVLPVGSRVAAGEALAWVHAAEAAAAGAAADAVLAAVTLGDEAPAEPLLVIDRIGAGSD